jgi:hypothetical protein
MQPHRGGDGRSARVVHEEKSLWTTRVLNLWYSNTDEKSA